VTYLIVRNWKKFQHYKDRTPPWIKNYLELLDDENYTSLPPRCRATLHGLWIAYAAARERLPDDTRTLSRRLSQQVFRTDLERLSDAGFIQLGASKPLASRAHARTRSREAESETDCKRQFLAKGNSVPPAKSERRRRLPSDVKQELDKLMPLLRDADNGSRGVIEAEAHGLPLAAVARVRESVELMGGAVGPGYVVNALRSERND
jgi:hypothetical protein